MTTLPGCEKGKLLVGSAGSYGSHGSHGSFGFGSHGSPVSHGCFGSVGSHGILTNSLKPPFKMFWILKFLILPDPPKAFTSLRLSGTSLPLFIWTMMNLPDAAWPEIFIGH